jgi:hypothetical protein
MAGPGIRIEVETRGLAELGDPARIKRAELAMVQAALSVVTTEAKAQAPTVRSQKYLGSFLDHARAVGTVKAVFPLTFLITGTGSHVIAPRQGGGRGGRRRVGLRKFKTESGTVGVRQSGNFRALRFPWLGGQTFFRKYIFHPGVPANPFLARAAQAADGRAGEAADRALQGIFNEIR